MNYEGEHDRAAPRTSPLETWNALPPEAALAAVLPCNGSLAWGTALASARPFATPQALLDTADAIWQSLPSEAWQQAFESHPRIGGTHARASAQSLTWSAAEQAHAVRDTALGAALAYGNRRYEARFGHIFLICASGKSAAEILEELERRMGNDPATEWREAGEQQRRITQLRLHRWLGLAAASA